MYWCYIQISETLKLIFDCYWQCFEKMPNLISVFQNLFSFVLISFKLKWYYLLPYPSFIVLFWKSSIIIIADILFFRPSSSYFIIWSVFLEMFSLYAHKVFHNCRSWRKFLKWITFPFHFNNFDGSKRIFHFVLIILFFLHFSFLAKFSVIAVFREKQD